MVYEHWYFENNFLKFLKLYVYSLNNKHLDKITDDEQVKDVIVNGFRSSNQTRNTRINLMNTINKYYNGLENIRITALWKSHIDIALAIFNNR